MILRSYLGDGDGRGSDPCERSRAKRAIEGQCPAGVCAHSSLEGRGARGAGADAPPHSQRDHGARRCGRQDAGRGILKKLSWSALSAELRVAPVSEGGLSAVLVVCACETNRSIPERMMYATPSLSALTPRKT